MRRSYISLLLLLLIGWSSGMLAQDAPFDPASPAEPGPSSIQYKLSLRVEPEEAGLAIGAGLYTAGSEVAIYTSRSQDFVFDHWEEDGEPISTFASFNYTTKAESKTLVAHYRYAPVNPNEPSTFSDYRLYLTTNIEGACWFNTTSGLKYSADEYVHLIAYVNTGYNFVGWFLNGQLVGRTQSFYYPMPFASTTLEARVEFCPNNPGEPNSTPYSRRGDVNEDGEVDVTDAVKVINVYLSGDYSSVKMSVADLNQDQVLDVTDAVAIINKYLRNE